MMDDFFSSLYIFARQPLYLNLHIDVIQLSTIIKTSHTSHPGRLMHLILPSLQKQMLQPTVFLPLFGITSPSGRTQEGGM